MSLHSTSTGQKHQQTEEALGESAIRYRELANSIADIFFALDKNLTFTYWNKASENLTGISEKDALGKSLYEIFPKMIGTKTEESYLKALKTRQSQSFIQLYPIKGKTEFFEINVYPFRDGLSVFAKNVTHHKKMENALKKSWDYFENLNNSLGDAIFTVKLPEQAIEYVNRAVEHIFGYTADECIGKHTKAFFPDKRGYVSFVRKLQETIKHQKDILRTEHELKRKEGEFFTAEITTTFLNETGELTGIISIVRDVTDRKQMERALEQERTSLARKVEERTVELKRTNAELARASRLKDEFLANISHDLRTPLNAILGYAKLLKKAEQLSQLQEEGLNTIQSSGEHLLTLINDILELAKIQAGRLTPQPNIFYFPDFLQQIANIMRIRAMQKGIVFLYESSPNLPKGVYADEKRLGEVLINLLDNAVKFTEKGGVTFNVEVKSCIQTHLHIDQRSGSPTGIFPTYTIRFHIKDTGSGISPEQLEEIFLPFQQVGQQHSHVEGTGLGLTISQQFVKMMGGTLNVNSTVNKGSTFWFELNIPEVSESIPDTSLPHPQILDYQGRRLNILIVDDKQENRAVLRNMLLPLGFEISEAENGQRCLELARDMKPDSILLDLRMPIMDGFETTRQLRKLLATQDIVIIAISASVSEEIRTKSLNAGCDDFLSKPLREERLLECLQTHLNLEWVYQEKPEDVPTVEHTEPTVLPVALPPEDIASLRKFAICGNITRILKQLDKIEGLGEQFNPFVKKVRALVKSFQIQEIIELLEKLEGDNEN